MKFEFRNISLLFLFVGTTVSVKIAEGRSDQVLNYALRVARLLFLNGSDVLPLFGRLANENKYPFSHEIADLCSRCQKYKSAIHITNKHGIQRSRLSA